MDINKILIRLFFITTFLALNANASIETNDPYCDPLVGSGLYLGLGVQRVAGDVDYDSSTAFRLGLLGRGFESADISATGYSGTALLGFGIPLIHHFYLGAEVQGSIAANQEGNLTVNSFFQDGPQILGFKARIKYLNNYGIFIRPGYYATQNYLLFLRAGYINGGFKVAAVPSELNAVVPSLDDVEQKVRVSGALFGAGIEMHIVKGLGARAEYDVMNYRSFKTYSTISFLVPGTTSETVTASTMNKFSPKAGVVTLALTYSFG